MIRKYYSVLNSVSLGTFPGRIHVTKICNYDCKTEVPDIRQAAWGYIETPDKLTKQECHYYGLVRGGKDL